MTVHGSVFRSVMYDYRGRGERIGVFIYLKKKRLPTFKLTRAEECVPSPGNMESSLSTFFKIAGLRRSCICSDPLATIFRLQITSPTLRLFEADPIEVTRTEVEA